MFYSHEVLTARKYGVATVWLVATHSLKRINRKQILEVDVSKACQTIVDPVAPMALRLQSNLLYGVSRVYLQQCGYILSDAEHAHNTLRVMLRTVKDTALDPDAGKTRPEQLIFEDDPSFLPELALPPPELLSELDHNFNLDIARSGDSQSLTPFASERSMSSSHANAIGELILPTSSPVAAGDFRLEGDDGMGSVGGPTVMLSAGNAVEIEDPDFMFGDDGEIIQLSPRRSVARTPARTPGVTMFGDAKLSAQVRKEHVDGQQTDNQFPGDQVDMDFPIHDDDPAEDEEFSSGGQQQSSVHSEVVESSDTFAAPMHRRRIPRTLPTDSAIELRNKELADWTRNYRQNMKAAARKKCQSRVAAQAKKNAEHYVWGSGIGGIGQRILSGQGPSPLDMFIGDNLFESITGLSRNKATRAKHDRDSGIDDATQEESRRVRQKTGEPEFGRSVDEDLPMLGDDDTAVELPREGVSALDDQQIFSAMPWNISASIRGSSAVPRSGRVDLMRSDDRGRPGSRFVSASPLHGRGHPIALEGPETPTSDVDYCGDDFGLPGSGSDYPETVVQGSSARVRGALSTEGGNFITFIDERIVEKREWAERDQEHMSDVLQPQAATDSEDITFEELLPPAENTKMIACQGFMMVLGLGSKGMLDVQQPRYLGEISLKLTGNARALQAVEISSGGKCDDHHVGEMDGAVEGDEEVDEQDREMQEHGAMDEQGGQFQEQFAAGAAAQEYDDNDSLYDY